VVLAYLASQTLLGGDEEQKLPYSEVQRLVFSHPERVDEHVQAERARSNPEADEWNKNQGGLPARFDAFGVRASNWSRWVISPLLTIALFVALAFFLANRRRNRISNEDLRAS
jgi:hypothetical protein